MSGIADRGHEVFDAIDEALEQIVDQQSNHEERLSGLDAGLRLELGALTLELRTLHKRIDRLETNVMGALAELKRSFGGARG